MSSSLRAAVFVLPAVVVACLAPLLPAQAHSELESSDPAAGQRLTEPPAQVRLTFSEDINAEFAVMTVITPGEQPLELAGQVKGPAFTAAVPAEVLDRDRTSDARWTLGYRVVSADGHPIDGRVRFTVAAQPVDQPVDQPTATGAPASDPSEVASETTDPPAEVSQADGSPAESGQGSNTALYVVGGVVLSIALVLALTGSRRSRARARAQKDAGDTTPGV